MLQQWMRMMADGRGQVRAGRLWESVRATLARLAHRRHAQLGGGRPGRRLEEVTRESKLCARGDAERVCQVQRGGTQQPRRRAWRAAAAAQRGGAAAR
jgi:hypothetical protein